MKSLKQVWDRSSPPPVADAGERSVGNRKERLRDYASSPDRQPNATHARSAKETRIREKPKAPILILIHSNRVFACIPTGCALRWALGE